MGDAADPPGRPHHPAIRAEIARSDEPTAPWPAHGVGIETARKWRKHGLDDCLDHPAPLHRLPRKATDEQFAVACALCRATNFALGDITFAVTPVLPHLKRESVCASCALRG